MRWVNKKNVDHDQVNNALRVSMSTNSLTNGGPCVRTLERKIRDAYEIDDSKAVIVTSSGHAALRAGAMAINYIHGNLLWAAQSFTFPASAQLSPARTVVLDIDECFGLDLEKVQPEVGALVVTNVFGNVVDLDKYQKFCDERALPLMYDNAATHMTYYKGKNVNNYGTASAISFHHTKPLGFGEGGALIIDVRYETAARSMINFGIGLTNSYWLPSGFNGKMAEIPAAYISTYMSASASISKLHGSKLYDRALEWCANQENFDLIPSFHDQGRILPACLCILAKRSSDLALQALREKGIEARRYYYPLTDDPVVKKMYNMIICLPCHVDITTEDLEACLRIMTSAVTVSKT